MRNHTIIKSSLFKQHKKPGCQRMQRKYPENFQVVKDPEEELYYAITKFPYDMDHEFSIFAQGATEEEARNNAISTIIRCLNECHKTFNSIIKMMSSNHDSNLREELYLPYLKIQRTVVTEHCTLASFDALGYDEGLKKW